MNVANLGRKPYIPLNGLIAKELIDLGFLMRGEIIWDKAASSSTSTAWGSWQSASNPTLRDTHEYILVFSKGSFRRDKMDGRTSTISREQFLEYTKSVWEIPSESARKVGHPAPFPVELPYRLIQLYTFSDEIVLDPFMGSGQTALAALKAGRHFIGYEISGEYLELWPIPGFKADNVGHAFSVTLLPPERRQLLQYCLEAVTFVVVTHKVIPEFAHKQFTF